MASKHHFPALIFLVLATFTCNMSLCVARHGMEFDSPRNESLLARGESYDIVLKQMVEVQDVGGNLSMLDEGERSDKVKSHIECLSENLRKSNYYGGTGGNFRDIDAARRIPCMLVSITIHYNGLAILAFTFQYRTPNHQTVTVGPWGRIGGITRTIHFEQGEDVVEIFGRTGDFNGQRIVTSFGVVTNRHGQIGPFGSVVGPSFSFFTNGRIVAFYGRSEQYLNALGAYYYP